MTRFAITLTLVAAAGCFNPKFQNGVPCTADRVCPEGQVCAADDRCYDPDKVPEFTDAGADAADDVLRVVEISAGGSTNLEFDGHTCARLSDGRLRCFGQNAAGQLGLGNIVVYGDNEPASKAPFVDLGPVTAIGAGFDSSCAVFADGELRCWGSNDHGELGLGQGGSGQIGNDEPPASVPPIDLGGNAVEVCGGDTYHCARLDSGQVRCFGLETNSVALGGSVLGIPGVTQIGADDRPIQFPAIDLGTPAIVDIDCGTSHVCAVNDDAAVFCWGVGNGPLGYPGVTGVGFNEHPAEMGPVDVGESVSQIAVGTGQTCALLSSGSVTCWGNAALLGYGTAEDIGDDEPPSTAGTVDIAGKAVEIKAGGKMTCVRLDNGDVRCWGFPNGHTAAPVGDNEPPSSFAPLPLPAPAVSLGVGYNHACAILDTHEVYCWGEGEGGRLGYGDEQDVGIGTSVITKGPVPILEAE